MPGYLVNGHREQPVEIPGTDGRTVTFKATPSYGDDLQCDVAALQAAAPSGVVLSEADQQRYAGRRTMAYVLARTCCMIASWDLIGADEQPLPVEPASLLGLTPAVGGWLATEARRRFEGRPKEDDRPFERPSPPPSTAEEPATPR
jgi:hypothetical protein